MRDRHLFLAILAFAGAIVFFVRGSLLNKPGSVELLLANSANHDRNELARIEGQIESLNSRIKMANGTQKESLEFDLASFKEAQRMWRDRSAVSNEKLLTESHSRSGQQFKRYALSTLFAAAGAFILIKLWLSPPESHGQQTQSQ